MSESWMDRLRMLVARLPQFVIGADLGAMTMTERWGVYCFLNRILEGGRP